MAKNGYTGKNLNVQWIGTGGTITLSGNQTSCTFNETIDVVEQTAGADTSKTFVPTVKDSKISFNALFQSGANAGGTLTFGTATIGIGMAGTLLISPEGTGSGLPKITVPAIPTSTNKEYPFSDLVKVSIDFQGNGDVVNGSN